MTDAARDKSCAPGLGQAEPLVSIIVNNFNYAPYLPATIDSALAQTYPCVEVIVVDDGSTDQSREIIHTYGTRIRPVLKSNGGQASALNAGFQVSRGDIVLFLDSDDILFPDALTKIVPRLWTTGISKVHWPMWLIDAHGQRTGGTRPAQVPPEGSFRQQVLERGPSNVASSPTSGNAWSRSVLERIMPIPEDCAYYRSCADEYLYLLAPVFGQVRTVAEPQGCYRLHDRNVYSSRSFRQKLEMELSGYDQQCQALAAALARNAIEVDVPSWKPHSWFHRLERAIDEVLTAVPRGSELVLIDDSTWGVGDELEGRSVRPFLERAGFDWGAPPADAQAIEQLQNVVDAGTQFLVIAWSSFWWLDEYPLFFERLQHTAECVHEGELTIIFNLLKRPAVTCCVYPIRQVDEDRHDV